jgi:hypothetical protein
VTGGTSSSSRLAHGLGADMARSEERAHEAVRRLTLVAATPLVRWLVILGAVITPAALCLAFLRAYAVNVPVYDEWRVVSMFAKLYDGTLTVMDVFKQHNEHIAAVPYAITLLLGYFTSYDTRVPMYLSWLVLCLISLLFHAMTNKIMSHRTWMVTVFIPIPWLLFGLRQWENLLLGIGISIMLANLLAILTFVLLGKTESFDIPFVTAIWCATLASFSFAHGLLIWPVGAVQLFVIRGFWGGLRRDRLFLVRLAVWSGAWIAVWSFYFLTFERALSDMHEANRRTMLEDPVQVVLYYVTALGAPLAHEGIEARLIGTALLTFMALAMGYLALFRRALLAEASVPVAVVLFALASAAAFMSGRVSLGLNQALASRYVSITTLAIVGLYILLLYGWQRRVRGGTYLVMLFVGMISFGMLAAYPRGNIEGQGLLGTRTTAAYYLATFDIQSDQNLAGVFPSPFLIRSLAPSLRENRLTVFRDLPTDLLKLPYADGATVGIIDAVNGLVVARQDNRAMLDRARDHTMTITGWAADGTARRAGRSVYLSIDGERMIPTIYGRERPEVAKMLETPSETGLGFLATFATAALGEGTHTITPVLVSADGSRLYLVGHVVTVDVR